MRIARLHDNGAGQRVTPLGGGLRAAVDFYLLHIPERQRVECQKTVHLQSIVKVDRDGAIHGGRALIVKACDRDTTDTPVLVARLGVHARGALKHTLQVNVTVIAQIISGYHRDTGERALGGAFYLLAGNHNRIQIQGLRLLVISSRR